MSSQLRASFGGLIRLVLLVAILAGLAAVAVMGPGAFWDKVGEWRSSLNPFEERTVDRTGPPVLYSLTDLSEYHAAKAHYEVVVDIEKDTEHMPDWLSGERVLYVGKGDVDAVVDFGELDERRIVASEDGTAVTINLPTPAISETVLDLEDSYVADHDEGVANSFSGSDLEREAQLQAVEQITNAATDEDTLIEMAEQNTTAMLRGLLGSLGFTDITITFDE